MRHPHITTTINVDAVEWRSPDGNHRRTALMWADGQLGGDSDDRQVEPLVGELTSALSEDRE